MSSSKRIIKGRFSRSDSEEIFLSRGKTLKLLQIEAKTGDAYNVFEHEMNDVICSLTTVNGKSKDYLMVGFELGSVGIFEYDTEKTNLKRIAYFKPGLFKSSIQPRYLLIDPTSRMVIMKTKKLKKMICGLEFEVDDTPRTFSPWSMNESKTMTAQMVWVEVSSNQNPMFASLEVDGISKETQLQFHELNLQSKQVKTLKPIPLKLDSEINLMIEACGGVLLFNQDMLSYQKAGNESVIQCSIPSSKTNSGSSESVTFCAFAKLNHHIIFLLSKKGEMFKLTIEMQNDDVTKMSLNYFDNVPKATDLCVLNSEFIFFVCDFGSYRIYKIKNIDATQNDNMVYAFGQQQLLNLTILWEFDADVESVFETSTSNLDMPCCNTILKRTAFGEKDKWTRVTIQIHKREMKIYGGNGNAKVITTEKLTNLPMYFEEGRENLLNQQKTWKVKWMSNGADYKLKFYEELEYRKFLQSRDECLLADTQRTSKKEGRPYVKIGITSTPKKSTSSSKNVIDSEQLKKTLEQIFGNLHTAIAAMSEALNEAIPQIISAVESHQRQRKIGELISLFDRDLIAKTMLIMKPFVLRRVKADVLESLPTKTVHTIKVEMAPLQKAKYKQIIKNYTAIKELIEQKTNVVQ